MHWKNSIEIISSFAWPVDMATVVDELMQTTCIAYTYILYIYIYTVKEEDLMYYSHTVYAFPT